MGQIHTSVYLNGELCASDVEFDSISDWLEKPDVVVWVDLYMPDADQLHALAHELGLHELAVEDALSEHQRPKVDFYDSHLFLSCHALSLDTVSGELLETEIDAFINHNWFVTVRKDDDFDVAHLVQRWDRSSNLAKHGAMFLLYGMIDVVIDGYFDVVEAFDQYYDEASELLFADQPLDPTKQQHWFHMRRALVRFHRLAVPMREMVSGLMRREHQAVSPEMYPYFQDVYDHILRVGESSEALRDLVATIVETNLSLRDFRQNQVMKRVSSWAAIIAVPTLITGYYGMNVPYPGNGTTSGAVVATVASVGLPIGLFIAFRKREWL